MRAKTALCWMLSVPCVYRADHMVRISRHCNRMMSTDSDSVGFGSAAGGPKFIDIGANLTDSMYCGIYYGRLRHSGDLKEVLGRAKRQGLKKIIITSGCLQDVYKALEICKRYDAKGNFLYTTAGVHPTNCNDFLNNKFNLLPDQYLDKLSELISSNKDRIVAIGELGLDYDRVQYCPADVQRRFFEFQLQLAEKHCLPLFLHMRNATDDTIEILTRHKSKWEAAGGVCHSFTSDANALERILSLGFYIGINGCSLKTDANLKILKHIPNEKILLETDCPWCGIKESHASVGYVKTKFESVKRPERMNGSKLLSQRNEPCQIIQVAEVVHAVKCPNASFSAFCDELYENTCKLFPGIGR